MESTNSSIQMVLGLKQPGREADNHRHSSKMKDKPAVTAVTVRICVVSEGCAFKFCSNGDVKYSSELKLQHYV